METCVWENHGESAIWYCGCGKHLFEFTEGGPEENNFKYCPYCGKVLIAEHIESEPE